MLVRLIMLVRKCELSIIYKNKKTARGKKGICKTVFSMTRLYEALL